jgi:predicted HTH domain antitoxin
MPDPRRVSNLALLASEVVQYLVLTGCLPTLLCLLLRSSSFPHKTGYSAMSTRQITLDVPEKVLLAKKTDEIAFAREQRILAAIKLYELGRLSSGRAAELAGMSQIEFLLVLGCYNVFPFLAELGDLEHTHA